MLVLIYFIILLVFLLLRFFKDKSCGFSDKKSLLVTIMMAVLMGFEVFDDIFNLCANTLNTSVNFKKVTDYGYIFGDRIYPKEVVENQFPLVKQYVETHYQPNR